MEIDIDGRRSSIEHGWDRCQVQETLLKSCLSLTQIDTAPGQAASLGDSIATCFIQHLSSHYSGFSNLSEVWGSSIDFKCTEEEWVQFRLRLKSENSSIDDIFNEFNWFQLIQKPFNVQFKCFAKNLGDQSIDIAQGEPSTSAHVNNYGPYYLWFDDELEICYNFYFVFKLSKYFVVYYC